MTRACQVFAFPRSTLYRLRQPVILKASEQCQSHRGLTPAERTAVHELLNSQRFCDLAPRQVYGILLDEGRYYCSISTMYRILREHDEVKERRRQRTRPHYVRPELLATGPNQVWSWDRILRSCFIKQADVLQGLFFFENDFDEENRNINKGNGIGLQNIVQRLKLIFGREDLMTISKDKGRFLVTITFPQNGFNDKSNHN